MSREIVVGRILSLDLEMNQPSGKIIQIGAIAGDLYTGEILERLRVVVDCGEPITEYIEALTGVTNDIVRAEGVSLTEGYMLLRDFSLRNKCEINPLTWGGGDSTDLREQLLEYGGWEPRDWPFGRRWVDVKTIFQTIRLARSEKRDGGLARCMTKFGMNFRGRKHDAQDDAENTFLFYRRLLEEVKK
jgi:inhibitor of KinA sporulation pathway (predicted exonuclease)